jgi:chromosome partitioning protein
VNIPVITFFNNKGGVGKTSLVYHLAWMFAELGKKVVAIDLDPQANLTAAFIPEDDLERLWNSDEPDRPTTVYRCFKPLLRTGDILEPEPKAICPGLHLIPGDLGLSSVEDALSAEWPASMGDRGLYRPFRILIAFWQIAQAAARAVEADLVLADVGPNLGAINRSALIASNFLVIPLGADLFSLQGLRNLGPTLREWRQAWKKRLDNWAEPEFPLPTGAMQPLGYIVQQHLVRLQRPVKAYDKWLNRTPAEYRESVLGQSSNGASTPLADPNCLAMLKHYRSLVPMAQEVRKPVFKLTPADGAIGAHYQAVRDAEKDFRALATKLLERMSSEQETPIEKTLKLRTQQQRKRNP